MFEGEKNILQAHTPRKEISVNKGFKKTLMPIPNHPPSPSKVKWLAPYPRSFVVSYAALHDEPKNGHLWLEWFLYL